MRRKNLVAVLIAILSALLIAFIWHSLQNKGHNDLPQDYAQQNQVRGIFPVDVSRRIESISAGIEKNRTVSDGDLDFLLKTSQSEPLNGAAENRAGVHLLALSPLVEVKHFTPLQQNKVLASVAPLLASSTYTDKHVALLVLDDLNFQAIPYIEPLTKDADPRVRQAAVDAINHITTHQSRS
jgi:hypothetical protein